MILVPHLNMCFGAWSCASPEIALKTHLECTHTEPLLLDRFQRMADMKEWSVELVTCHQVISIADLPF